MPADAARASYVSTHGARAKEKPMISGSCTRRVVCWLLAVAASMAIAPSMARTDDAANTIRVANRQRLSFDTISCERIPLGEPDDYKPCIALLPSGELV